MASLITCPHCGPRPTEEFTIRGDASVRRPAPDAARIAKLKKEKLRIKDALSLH